jgi:hypothetical protein
VQLKIIYYLYKYIIYKMIINIILFILFISHAHAFDLPVVIRTTGSGDLSTSLDATQCQAYAASLSGYTWGGADDWGTGQAVGCSVVEANKYVRYNSDDRTSGGQGCIASVKCIDSGVVEDFYEEFDPESAPLAQSIWDVKDVSCGPNKFVTISGGGELVCGDCSGSNDPAAFLAEFSIKRKVGSGLKHGKCCINSHHKVCHQLMNSYKNTCTDDDGDKGHAIARTCAA